MCILNSFFFFKQKTAYEVRISDWSSDVCSSDLAFAEDHVPSTGEYDPYMHVFLDAGNGNILAFFELPNQPDMGRDQHTPQWVQHLAFKVGRYDELVAAKEHLIANGVDVPGPRSEERRVGKEGVSTCEYRWWS